MDKLDKFIKQHRPYFKRNEEYLISNTWHLQKTQVAAPSSQKAINKIVAELVSREKSVKADETLVANICSRLSAFIKRAEADRHLSKVKEFIDYSSEIILLFIKKCNVYIDLNNITEIVDAEIREAEISLQDTIFNTMIKLQDKLDDMNVNSEVDSIEIKLYGKDTFASLVMKEPLTLTIPDVRRKVEEIGVEWNILSSKEMYKNMNPKDVPQWNDKKHFWDQDAVVLQFWTEEYNKIKNGITIGGFFIHPWVYFHLNFYKTPIPQPDGSEPIINPYFRDNEWFFSEMLKKAEDAKDRGIVMYGSRRIAKSVILSSYVHWKAITKFNSVATVTGGSDGDLSDLTDKIRTSMTYIEKPFFLYMINQDWDNGHTTLGVRKDASTPIKFSTIAVKNLAQGAKKSTQKTAGGAPSAFVNDEIGKYDFLKSYLAALPSFETPYGFKCVPIMAGCVCKGTKVWNNEGKLINIEDLNQEEGILGFNIVEQKISKENIVYQQENYKKPCYRIETNTGRVLECSEDHPILYRSRDESEGHRSNRTRKVYFKKAENIKEGDQIVVIEDVPFFSEKEMWNPRLVGLLVGDGSYGPNKTPVLSNCNKEVNDYVYNNFDAVEEKSYITSKGDVYKETRIRGIRSNLRELGIIDQTKKNKTLPKNIHSYSKESICEFLGGFFDADGHVIAKGVSYTVNLSSGHKSILQEVQILLQKLGIHGGIYHKKPNYKNKKTPKNSKGHYLLVIADRKSILSFYENISFIVKHKQSLLEKCVKILTPRKNKIPKELKGVRLERVVKKEYIGEQFVYNLTAYNTHTYIANGIITHNTGGEADLSADAMKVLKNPGAYNMLAMDYDLLEQTIDPEYITWKRSSFATFFPGQMSYHSAKIDKKLSDFLGIKNKDLDKIEIQQTDWKNSLAKLQKVLEEKLKEKGANKTLLEQQHKVQYPLDPQDCFLSTLKNPFLPMEVRKHKEKLIETGDTGKKVRLRKENGKVVYDLAPDVELAEYPFSGGFCDAPVVIYIEPPAYDEMQEYEFVAGLDDYKHEEGAGDSVGSFTIYRRNCFDERGNMVIAATYDARPDPHSKLHKQGLLLLELYNAECFPENEDMDFKLYLDTQRVTYRYLVKGINLAQDLDLNSAGGRREFGWTPTPKNIAFGYGLVKKYVTETLEIKDEDGTVIATKFGFERIKSIGLLEELENFKPDQNFDRLRSFMSALMYDHYLTSQYIIPKAYVSPEERRKKELEKMFKKNKKRGGSSLFGKSPGNPFSK